jgi:hypothetical protein
MLNQRRQRGGEDGAARWVVSGGQLPAVRVK